MLLFIQTIFAIIGVVVVALFLQRTNPPWANAPAKYGLSARRARFGIRASIRRGSSTQAAAS
jgi:hypothetical protein